MLSKLNPTIYERKPSSGARWRLSTWWPSDSRDAMRQSLLRLLAVAHSERLDPTPLVSNLAEEHRGSYRRRLRRLASRLSDGTQLVDALEQTPDALRDEEVLAIRFASQSGTLSSTYETLVSDSVEFGDRSTPIRRQTLIYSLVTLLILGLSCAFLLFFIVPTLRHMQQEFGLNGSSLLFDTFIMLSDWIVRYAPLLILGVLVIAFLCWSAPSRRFFRRIFAGNISRGVSQLRSSQMLQLLANTVAEGRPLPSAISTLGRYHFDRSARRKLLFARNEIEQGTDVWTSLADARLITPAESNAIAHSSSVESRAWTMRRLADWKLHGVSTRTENRMRFVQPFATLIFASVVLLVGGGLFSFLAQMIQSLAGIY